MTVYWYRYSFFLEDKTRMIGQAFCMMAGTASLPHILMRYFTTPSVKAARQSVAWSLLFIFLLYFTAPALATFTKLQVLDPNLATGIIGKAFADVQALDWIQNWSNVGFLKIIDSNNDGNAKELGRLDVVLHVAEALFEQVEVFGGVCGV